MGEYRRRVIKHVKEVVVRITRDSKEPVGSVFGKVIELFGCHVAFGEEYQLITVVDVKFVEEGKDGEIMVDELVARTFMGANRV